MEIAGSVPLVSLSRYASENTGRNLHYQAVRIPANRRAVPGVLFTGEASSVRPVYPRYSENQTAPLCCGHCTHKGIRFAAASQILVEQSGEE